MEHQANPKEDIAVSDFALLLSQTTANSNNSQSLTEKLETAIKSGRNPVLTPSS